MSSWREGLEDNTTQIIEELVEGQNYVDYQIEVSPASKKGDNYLGVIYRISVTGTKYGKKNSKWSFIVKCCPAYQRKFPVHFIYEREYFVYKTVLPSFRQMEIDFGVSADDRFSFTPCLGGDMTDLKEMIVLDDLTPQGFTMGQRRVSLTFIEMVLLFKSLAQLHSFSFAMRKYNPERLEKYANYVTSVNEFDESFEPLIMGAFSNAINALDDEKAKKKVQDFSVGCYQKMMAYATPSDDEPYKVLTHGDCWINNIMFKYENKKLAEVRLLDWQIMKYSYPILDLAHLLWTCTDENIRAKHYEELVNLYYYHLRVCLHRLGCDINTCYPEKVFRRQVKEVMPFGLMMSIMTAPMFMCDDEDIVDMGEMMNKDEFSADDLKLKGSKGQELYVQRIRGVVNDFIRLGLL